MRGLSSHLHRNSDAKWTYTSPAAQSATTGLIWCVDQDLFGARDVDQDLFGRRRSGLVFLGTSSKVVSGNQDLKQVLIYVTFPNKS
jgi:hypothetical protein